MCEKGIFRYLDVSHIQAASQNDYFFGEEITTNIYEFRYLSEIHFCQNNEQIIITDVPYNEVFSTVYSNEIVNFGGQVVGDRQDLFFFVNGVYIPAPKWTIENGNVRYVYNRTVGDEYSIKYRQL